MASVTAQSSTIADRKRAETPRKLDQLAPALVVITLVAIVLSVLGERAGAPDTAVLSLNVISYHSRWILRRQERAREPAPA